MYCNDEPFDIYIVKTFSNHRISISNIFNKLKINVLNINNISVNYEIIETDSYFIINLIEHRFRNGDTINLDFQYGDCEYSERFIID